MGKSWYQAKRRLQTKFTSLIKQIVQSGEDWLIPPNEKKILVDIINIMGFKDEFSMFSEFRKNFDNIEEFNRAIGDTGGSFIEMGPDATMDELIDMFQRLDVRTDTNYERFEMLEDYYDHISIGREQNTDMMFGTADLYTNLHKAQRIPRKRSKYGRKKRVSKGLANTIKAIAKSAAKDNVADYRRDLLTFGSISWNENNAYYFYSVVGDKNQVDTLLSDVDINTRITTSGPSTLTWDRVEGVDLGLLAESASFESIGFKIKNIERIFKFKNNTSLEYDMVVYELTPKFDLEKSVQQLFEGSYDDKWEDLLSGATATDGLPDNKYNDPRVYLQHAPLVNQAFYCRRKEHYELPPGGEINIKHYTGEFTYYPEYFASGFNTNIQSIGGVTSTLVVRLQGKLGHDTTDDTLVGFTDGKVDYARRQMVRIGTGFLFEGQDIIENSTSTSFHAVAIGQAHTGDHHQNGAL